MPPWTTSDSPDVGRRVCGSRARRVAARVEFLPRSRFHVEHVHIVRRAGQSNAAAAGPVFGGSHSVSRITSESILSVVVVVVDE